MNASEEGKLSIGEWVLGYHLLAVVAVKGESLDWWLFYPVQDLEDVMLKSSLEVVNHVCNMTPSQICSPWTAPAANS